MKTKIFKDIIGAAVVISILAAFTWYSPNANAFSDRDVTYGQNCLSAIEEQASLTPEDAGSIRDAWSEKGLNPDYCLSVLNHSYQQGIPRNFEKNWYGFIPPKDFKGVLE